MNSNTLCEIKYDAKHDDGSPITLGEVLAVGLTVEFCADEQVARILKR